VARAALANPQANEPIPGFCGENQHRLTKRSHSDRPENPGASGPWICPLRPREASDDDRILGCLPMPRARSQGGEALSISAGAGLICEIPSLEGALGGAVY
jgi:hypothetical protein